MNRRSQYQLLKTDADTSQPIHRRRRVGWILLAFFSALAISFYCFYPPESAFASSDTSKKHIDVYGSWNTTSAPLKQCVPPLAPPAKPPAPINLWAPLTVPETASIQAWLEHPDRKLNLTRVTASYPSSNPNSSVSLADNSIFVIESYHPPKEEALAYLDSADPHKAEPPTRYARVTIHHGAAKPKPVIRDYLVGPLPVGKDTQLKPLKEIYHTEDGEIPWNARGFLNGNDFNMLWASQTPKLREAMEDLFNASLSGLQSDTLTAGGSGPFSFDGSFRRMWLSWRRNVPGPWLHPINFFQYVDVSGTDPSQWGILKIVYNWQVFGSVDEFVEAWKNGTLVRNPPILLDDSDSNAKYNWTQRLRTGTPRDLDHLPGPRSVSFAGLRFRVDQQTQYISWMGWGFYLSFDRDMGLGLYDIRLQNSRIIYQLAPQEAMAQYAGNDPMQTSTAWLDRFFGMGLAVRDLMPYYDCPAEAVYLPATTMSPVGSFRREKAICVFESDSGRPITRHTGWMEGEFGATKGYVLTVRSTSTVGNYDYMLTDAAISCHPAVFDYMFHLDGTIEVRLSASGYLQGGYWEPKQEGYGGKIRDSTMGNLHDHVINFKVDFDIAGTSNTLLETTTAQETVTQPWFDDDWGNEVIQQKITKRYIENENEALLKYPTNFQGGYSIVNQEETNKWGYPRGYAIHPGYSPVHNTVVGSKRLLNNANWARYNLAVSKRKESEPSSSSMWNMNLPGNPAVDFHKFFDGENITQTDLVAWINVGTHHLPQAEDSPNTKTNVATSSFILTPLNYFDADISMESSNAILLGIPQADGDPYTFEDYGVKQDFSCIPEPLVPFEYSTIRSFDLDGREKKGGNTEDMRKMAELFHRIKFEL